MQSSGCPDEPDFRVGSKSEELSMNTCLPGYPCKRTLLGAVGMSQLCHQRTHALQQISSSFDHLVSARQDGLGHRKVEGLGRF